ncbi:phosphatidic acid phosphatase-related protein [Micromonas commoda]|uniref:Phosphatidic acid phosphatase-related protein n=1 Tax=Micromonas commoda (strain RCC299 / NOUM17 / CCMP2709) TaxID=296587 RepID=C1FDH6_MICCC|nr:phosphatidic acid phosphatase-related protein [Micromonas commoda]ACO68789.1 phosphatidic acid phosphatase-related protein [Micromonas commoda]|eukprot:XP_002507531.1 phosphatidic acid phosphatase-related protein [Micromonas commoda]
MQTPLRPTARGDRHLALHRCAASHVPFMRPAVQISSCIGKAIFTLPMRAEVAWSSDSATSSLRRARPAFARCAIARDIHDLPPSAPASSAQLQSNLVKKNMYRGTKRFSVRAVSEKVGAVLKGHFVKNSSVSSGVSSRTACSAADSASCDFFAQCTTTAAFATVFAELSGNLVFMCAFWSWLTAQTMKYFTAFYREGKWDWRVMFDSGGMPSSHTSLVVGLTTAIAYQYGLGSTLFPLSLAFSLIVMYDAAGVRRHAGKQAEVLNKILEDMFHGESISERKLKEVLGHSPLQVMAGAVLGVFVAVLYAYQYGSGYAALS